MTDTTNTAGSARTRALALALFLASLALGLLAAPPARADHQLTLSVTKTEGGTVTSGDGEVDCGTDCTGTYAHVLRCESEPGSEHICWEDWPSATLTATPAPGYRFVGWSGACSGTGSTCHLNMTADRTVHAEFANSPPSVTIDEPARLAWTRGTFTVRATITDDLGVVNFPTATFLQRDSSGQFRETAWRQIASSTSTYSTSFTASETYPDGPQAGYLKVKACDHAAACTTDHQFFGIDRVQPTFADFSAAPTGIIGPGTQVWIFEAGDATSGIADGYPACKIDNQAAQPCAWNEKAGAWELRDTYTTSGTHIWDVTVRDRAGHQKVEQRSFTVDADPPETSITTGPADGSSSTATTATFNFGAEPTDTGNTFRCRIYAVGSLTPTFGDCSGPGTTHTTTGLPPGTYRFEVAARDAVGNTDPTPAARTFTVTAPPTEGGGGDTGSGGTGTGDTGTGTGTGTGETGSGDTGSGSTGTGTNTGNTDTGAAAGASVGTTVTQPTNTVVQAPAQQNVTPPAKKKKPGKCAKLKGKKRAACVRKACGKLKKKKATKKKYKACVKKVTRKR